MKAVILAAVSTADKTQDPEVQVAAVSDAARRLGWEVVHVLRFKQSRFDSDSEREVQAAVIEAATQHGADVVMVEALDRIARGKPRKTMRFIIDTLEQHHGFHFWSRREPFLSTSNDSFREPLIALFSWLANEESAQKSSRGRQKAAYKRQAAEKLGQRANWGRGKMATDDDRRKAHELRVAGQTVRAISTALGLSVGAVHKMLQEKAPESAGVTQTEAVATAGKEEVANRSGATQ